MIIKAITKLQAFRKEEDGLALTEYLILLGLLTGAVIGAVLLFGENVGGLWGDWAAWIGSGDIAAPEITGTGTGTGTETGTGAGG